MDSEIAGWRIAYDTVSALVAVDQSRAVSQLARQPMSASPGSAAAAAGGRDVSGSCVASETSSHCDNREVIQRQRQQQQQRGGLTQSSASTVYHSLHNVYSDYSSSPPTVTSLPGSNHFQSAAPMTPLAAECGTRGNVGVVLASSVDDRQIEDAARLVHDVDAVVGLFRRLLDTFYMETMLWMYSCVLIDPAARRTRNRLHWLGVVTGRDLEQAASNVLTGFVAGYRQSRQALNFDVEEALATTGSARAERLARLAVEVGVILNPRQMMRSFFAVVRDLVFRTSSQAVLTNTRPRAPANRRYRYITQFILLIKCCCCKVFILDITVFDLLIDGSQFHPFSSA